MLVGNGFEATHFQPCAFLYHFDERAGFAQAVVRTRVKPGKAPPEKLDV